MERGGVGDGGTRECQKVSALVDVKVLIEPPTWIYDRSRYADDPVKRRETLIKEWVVEFQAFVRDHRSQDEAQITVEPVVEIQCSACGREWDDSLQDDYCAHCGAALLQSREAGKEG